MSAGAERGPLFAAAQGLFMALLVSLALMRPSVSVFGMAAVLTDFLYLLLVPLWTAALARGEARLRWNAGLAAIAIYFATLALSALGSQDPLRSGYKMLTQAYLVSLPLIASSLIDTRGDLRRALLCWLAGSAIVAIVAVAGLILFAVDPGHPLLAPMVNEFGTLPPGNYPRLRLTYEYASLLCNYLTVSILILLAAAYLGWMARRTAAVLLAGIGLAAAFTLTPGLGGVALAIGLWLWLTQRSERPLLAGIGLAAGAGAAFAFVAAASVTPILHPTAPFLIQLPVADLTLAPAVRMMTWLDALRNFAAEPWLGRGIGMDAVSVHYQGPSGLQHMLTDAHNGFLNIAVQAGIFGLAAFLVLLGFILRKTIPLRLQAENAVRLALGLALLNALAYQGLFGSFEDARYLWAALGLFLAADRIERKAGELPPSLQARNPPI